MSEAQVKATPSKAVVARFLRSISRVGECWLWTGRLNWKGYSELWDGSKRVRGHRFSYEYFVGKIPEGLQIDHLCRNRKCVNPSHLEPVTAKDNSRRGYSPAAIQGRKTQCDKGHPFTLLRSGRRGCKICYRESQKVWEKRNVEHINEMRRLRRAKKKLLENKSLFIRSGV